MAVNFLISQTNQQKKKKENGEHNYNILITRGNVDGCRLYGGVHIRKRSEQFVLSPRVFIFTEICNYEMFAIKHST